MVLGEETFKLCVPDANTLEWVESRAMGIYLGRDSSREVGVNCHEGEAQEQFAFASRSSRRELEGSSLD